MGPMVSISRDAAFMLSEFGSLRGPQQRGEVETVSKRPMQGLSEELVLLLKQLHSSMEFSHTRQSRCFLPRQLGSLVQRFLVSFVQALQILTKSSAELLGLGSLLLEPGRSPVGEQDLLCCRCC